MPDSDSRRAVVNSPPMTPSTPSSSLPVSSPSPVSPPLAPPPLAIPVQPCTDPHCSVHGRGADPARTASQVCARQILRACDRAEAIALLEQEVPRDLHIDAERMIIPLQSAPLRQGESNHIRCTSSDLEVESFRAAEIYLFTDASWRIDDIL